MNNILVATYTTPGYAPNELIRYLNTRPDVSVTTASVPAKHERKRFISGLSHYTNFKSVEWQAEDLGKHFNIGIGSDPAFTLAMSKLRHSGIVDKVIYWRLDYYPKRGNPIVNALYQKIETWALDEADEIWSISDPEISYIKANLHKYSSKVKYVPYLLHQDQVQANISSSQSRRDLGLWMGPDLDGSRLLCTEAMTELDTEFFIADYSIDKHRVEQDVLDEILGMAKVGLAVYKPEPLSSKYFADVSRIRRFLAHGVPVVTTDVTPTHTTLTQENCGSICSWDSQSIKNAVQYCLDNFEELSENAYRAAQRYTFENWFSEYSLLP